MRRLIIFSTVALLLLPATALAQSETSPEAVNKAGQIFQKVIEALGGDAFLNVTGMYRTGRIYDFDHGVLSSAGSKFKNYVQFPGKEWMEYGKKGNIVFLNNGDQGWELDRQGISEQTPGTIESWNDGNKRDTEYLFRFRVLQEKLPLYYIGKEYIDNRMMHIIEIVDTNNEALRLYVDSRSYLPMQFHYSRHSELRRGRVAIAEYYGKYITVDGVQTPLHISRTRDGLRVMEVFLKEVFLNHPFDPNFFTLANLEIRWKKVK